MPAPEAFITFDDAVELTGLAPSRLRALVSQGAIKSNRRNSPRLFSWADVSDYATCRGSGKAAVFAVDGLFCADGAPITTIDGGAAVTEDSIEAANCVDWLSRLRPKSVQTFVTSPPYWGQRRYTDETAVQWGDGSVGVYGRERTIEEYVQHTAEILRRMKRALRDDGTVWWVMGDTYQTRTIVRSSTSERLRHYEGRRSAWAENPDRRYSSGHEYLKDKDLTLAPFHVANAAQHLGYFVRSVIVWSKQSAKVLPGKAAPSRMHMPEPVADRPNLGHEYVILLAKSRHYQYSETQLGERLRTVWSFPPESLGIHSAGFPEALAERCILLTSRKSDLVADPFSGSGTTLVSAKRLGRTYAGCDISPTYVRKSQQRLAATSGPPTE